MLSYAEIWNDPLDFETLYETPRGNMTVKVEIGNYREMEKGFLKGFFSLCIYPEGLKISDCKHFSKNGEEWFNFPQKKIEKDGQKTEYIPYITYLNKEYLAQLNKAVLDAIKERNASSTSSKPQSSVQSNTSEVWF